MCIKTKIEELRSQLERLVIVQELCDLEKTRVAEFKRNLSAIADSEIQQEALEEIWGTWKESFPTFFGNASEAEAFASGYEVAAASSAITSKTSVVWQKSDVVKAKQGELNFGFPFPNFLQWAENRILIVSDFESLDSEDDRCVQVRYYYHSDEYDDYFWVNPDWIEKAYITIGDASPAVQANAYVTIGDASPAVTEETIASVASPGVRTDEEAIAPDSIKESADTLAVSAVGSDAPTTFEDKYGVWVQTGMSDRGVPIWKNSQLHVLPNAANPEEKYTILEIGSEDFLVVPEGCRPDENCTPFRIKNLVLSEAELCQRLGVAPNTMKDRFSRLLKEDFASKTQSEDPDNIAWQGAEIPRGKSQLTRIYWPTTWPMLGFLQQDKIEIAYQERLASLANPQFQKVYAERQFNKSKLGDLGLKELGIMANDLSDRFAAIGEPLTLSNSQEWLDSLPRQTTIEEAIEAIASEASEDSHSKLLKSQIKIDSLVEDKNGNIFKTIKVTDQIVVFKGTGENVRGADGSTARNTIGWNSEELANYSLKTEVELGESEQSDRPDLTASIEALKSEIKARQGSSDEEAEKILKEVAWENFGMELVKLSQVELSTLSDALADSFF